MLTLAYLVCLETFAVSSFLRLRISIPTKNAGKFNHLDTKTLPKAKPRRNQRKSDVQTKGFQKNPFPLPYFDPFQARFI